jgi:hypothetical protein
MDGTIVTPPRRGHSRNSSLTASAMDYDSFAHGAQEVQAIRKLTAAETKIYRYLSMRER